MQVSDSRGPIPAYQTYTLSTMPICWKANRTARFSRRSSILRQTTTLQSQPLRSWRQTSQPQTRQKTHHHTLTQLTLTTSWQNGESSTQLQAPTAENTLEYIYSSRRFSSRYCKKCKWAIQLRCVLTCIKLYRQVKKMQQKCPKTDSYLRVRFLR